MNDGKIIRLYEVVCGSCWRPEHGHDNKEEFMIKLRDRGWVDMRFVRTPAGCVLSNPFSIEGIFKNSSR